MDHVGSGKEWDLARKNGGLVILPPYGFTDEVYNTRLEAIKSISSFINHIFDCKFCGAKNRSGGKFYGKYFK